MMPPVPTITLAVLLVLGSTPLFSTEVPLAPLRLAPDPDALLVDVVAGDGATLVVFATGGRVAFQRIDPEGDPIDEAPVGIISGNGGNVGSVGYDGERWRVVWTDAHGRWWATTISKSGEVGPHHEIGSPSEQASAASLNELAVIAGTSSNLFTIQLLDGSGLPSSSFDVRRDQRSAIGLARLVDGWFMVLRGSSGGNAISLLETEGRAGPGYSVELPSARATFHPHPLGGGVAIAPAADGLYAAVLGYDGSWSRPRFLGADIDAFDVVASGTGWKFLMVRKNADHSNVKELEIAEVAGDLSIISRETALMDVPGWRGLELATHASGDLVLVAGWGVRLMQFRPGDLQQIGTIALAPARQSDPEIARAPGMSIVTWLEPGREEMSLRATRIDAAGVPIDGEGLLLAERASSARVAFDGVSFLVAWIEWGDTNVRFRRVPMSGPAGEGVSSFAPSIEGLDPHRWSLAGGEGGRSLLLWYQWMPGDPLEGIAAALVVEGVPQQSQSILREGVDPVPTSVEAVWNGEAWLLAGEREIFCFPECGPKPAPLSGRIVSASGAPLGPAMRWASNGPSSSIAGISGGWLLAWEGVLARLDSMGREVIRTDAPGGLITRYREALAIVSPFGRMEVTAKGELARWVGSQAGFNVEVLAQEGELRIIRRNWEDALLLERVLDAQLPHADLALVRIGGSQAEGRIRYRIEHRGGATVTGTRVHYELPIRVETEAPGFVAASSGGLRFDRDFEPGDSLEFELVFDSPSELGGMLWVLPLAIDDSPRNNGVTVELAERTRAVRR